MISTQVEGRRQYGDDDAGAVGGPLALRARYPRDAVEAAAATLDEAADRYVAWMTDPAEASWMRTRLIFTRDSQVRQAVAAKRVSILGERFGAVGRDLAKAMNGRLDMQGSWSGVLPVFNLPASRWRDVGPLPDSTQAQHDAGAGRVRRRRG